MSLVVAFLSDLLTPSGECKISQTCVLTGSIMTGYGWHSV